MEEIKWKTYQYIGAAVYLSEEDLKADKPITDRTTLAPGTAVIVPSLFGYARAVVGTGGMAETEFNFYNLTYDDERGFWVSDCCTSKSCLGLLFTEKPERVRGVPQDAVMFDDAQDFDEEE